MFLKETYVFIHENEFKDEDLTNLKDDDFGLPDERRFPMHNKQAFSKSLKMFHYCPVEKRMVLAQRLNRRSKDYNIDLSKNKEIGPMLKRDGSGGGRSLNSKGGRGRNRRR
jgi:hypothetical protein